MDNKELFKKHRVGTGVSHKELKAIRRKIRRKQIKKLKKSLS